MSANTQLILGNYTNVSSSVGAGIAAGAGLTLLKRQNRAHRLALAAHDAAIEARGLAEETHRLLHLAFPDHAAALGQQPGRMTHRHRPPASAAGAAGPAASRWCCGVRPSGAARPAPAPASGPASPSGLAPDPATPPGPDSGPDLP